MTDFVHFDGFRAPLSSALFYIRLVIRYFSKTTEDRASSAKIGPPQMNAFETPDCISLNVPSISLSNVPGISE